MLRLPRALLLLLILPPLLITQACGEKGPVDRSWGEMKGLENIVGNQNDTSYSSGRTQSPRLNALGQPVSMPDFEGRFVWAEYATVATASSWAGRFGLDAERVLAAELWFKTVPEHRFYSPEGHTLFVHVGSLNADQIRQVISHYRADYEEWSRFSN